MARLVFCFGLLVTLFSHAEETNQFKAFFTEFDSLSADFEQSRYDAAGLVLDTTTGHVQFQRPQQLLWQAHAPNQQTLLLNQDALWLIDFDLEQASLQNFNQLQETPLYWFINPPNAITNWPQYTATQGGLDWYTTEQKNQLRFGFQDEVLRAISLNNALGQTLVLRLSKLTINPAIDQALFTLKINPAFDVIQ